MQLISRNPATGLDSDQPSRFQACSRMDCGRSTR